MVRFKSKIRENKKQTQYLITVPIQYIKDEVLKYEKEKEYWVGISEKQFPDPDLEKEGVEDRVFRHIIIQAENGLNIFETLPQETEMVSDAPQLDGIRRCLTRIIELIEETK